jgi:hypothetical protein
MIRKVEPRTHCNWEERSSNTRDPVRGIELLYEDATTRCQRKPSRRSCPCCNKLYNETHLHVLAVCTAWHKLRLQHLMRSLREILEQRGYHMVNTNIIGNKAPEVLSTKEPFDLTRLTIQRESKHQPPPSEPPTTPTFSPWLYINSGNLEKQEDDRLARLAPQQRTSHDPHPQQHTDNANWNTPTNANGPVN